MPIYEYECEQCGQITEELQRFNDKPLKKCKSCKGKLHRIISLSSFQLTGHGWYSTDYAKGPGIPPKAAEQDNPALSSDSAKDSASATAASAEPITTDPKKIKKSGMANMSKSAAKD
ncbi:MAG: FmdB family zinc ribbon protein [Deltaproteobacteria bacterium]